METREPQGSGRHRAYGRLGGATGALFVAVGIMLILGGALATATSIAAGMSGPWPIVLAAVGTVFTGTGGVVVSWVGASAHEKANANRELESHLFSVSQNLSLATSQVENVISQVDRGEARPELGLAMVGQAMLVITGQINQLQILVGEPLDTQEWVETRNRVRALARDVADIANSSQSASKEELTEISNRLDALSAQLAAAPASKLPVVPKTTSLAAAQCPYCGQIQEVRIGDRKGDSKTIGCTSCERHFNAHRTHGGRVITRPAPFENFVHDVEIKTVVLDDDSVIECACGAELVLHNNEPPQKDRKFFCGACGRSYVLPIESGTPELLEQLEVVHGEVVAKRGRVPVTTCPRCLKDLRTLVRIADGYAAVCKPDKLVIQVAETAFRAFVMERMPT